ncbi:MAG: VanZ family protein [Pseudomonadales bacterium]|nr:VanZ family protein [Pseudomonadales bacterium]
MFGILRILFHLAFWLPLGVCTWLALVPDLPDNPVFRLSDIVLHAGAFIYLTFALVLVLETGPRSAGKTPHLQVAGWMLVYGCALEVAQHFLPVRVAEFKDLLVDAIGIAIGLVCAHLLSQRVRDTATRLLSLF